MIKRSAARAVVFDDRYRIAVLSVRNGMYHKIPGGGIDTGETVEQALKREVAKEAACEIEVMEKLGELKFTDPGEVNLVHQSVCYLAKKTKDLPVPESSGVEPEKNFELKWLDFDDAIEKFESTLTRNSFELAMNNRDLAFVRLARQKLDK